MNIDEKIKKLQSDGKKYWEYTKSGSLVVKQIEEKLK